MNIVFFGTSEFAVPVLKELIASRHKVRAVVTQPDRPKGRDLKLSKPPVKVIAEVAGLPVHQPLNASSADSIEHLNSFNADVFVVVSFGQILKNELLSVPKFCALNVHASLLPKYRGASPINRAIMNGDDVTGITIMRMNEKLDEGDILIRRELAIKPEDTAITIGEELGELSGRLLLEALDLVGYGKAVFEKQDEGKATYAAKLKKSDGLIDWNESAQEINNKIRALLPWPGAYTHFGDKVIKVFHADVVLSAALSKASPGEVLRIISKKGIAVNTGSGEIVITHLQIEGKKVLDADAFLRGHKIEVGDIFK